MYKINYEIILKSNFLTAQNGVIGKDIDITYKRDYDGTPIIYGKHIKGILRERYSQFSNALSLNDNTNEIFGSKGNKISKIYFSNLKIENINKVFTSERTSIKLNKKRKVSEEKGLFDYEFLERNQKFIGEIELSDVIDKESLKLLIASLFHLDKIGGLKSRGLGKVEVKVENKSIDYLEKIVDEIYDSYSNIIENKKENIKFCEYNFELKFLSPLVLKKIGITNIVETRTDLQGSTIRGALIDLGLKKGYDIKDLLNIEVKLYNDEIKLNSVFKTKYKIDGKYKYIDKVISGKIEEKGNKYQNYIQTDFENIEDDISIEIDKKSKTAKNGFLFNNEIISKIENNMPIYKGRINIPSDLIEEKETIYIGKYKSKGFGKVEIKISQCENNLDISVKDRIEKLNDIIKDKEYKYITFDLISDLILPNLISENILLEFLELIDKENKFNFIECIDKSFVKVEILSGYSIINNIRKADEIVVKRGSVLTYKLKNISSELYIKLENLEKIGIGLRKKEGFGMIKICSNSQERVDNNENFC